MLVQHFVIFSFQIAVLDVLLLSFFVTSTLIVMALGIGHLKGSLKHLGIFTKPQGIFLQMDSFACLLFGILWLMCPGWLLSPETAGSSENLQLHLTRTFGAMMVGDSFASFATQSQLDTSEASVFSSRMVGTVMLLMVLFHNQLTVWTSPCISVGLVLAGLWTGNSVLGYRASKEDHTGVSVEEIYKQSLQKKEHSYYIKV
ncbi:hypothetical protein NFI96_016990 [Prochilodus magdalenae]|nr:hypothetical protein NFI96_016990 [Prochilodus magdalenae]